MAAYFWAYDSNDEHAYYRGIVNVEKNKQTRQDVFNAVVKQFEQLHIYFTEYFCRCPGGYHDKLGYLIRYNDNGIITEIK